MKKLDPDSLPILIGKEDLPAIRRLLAEAKPPLTKTQLGNGLIAATGPGKTNAEIARLLLEHGANPEQRYIIGPVLQCAALDGNLAVVRVLLEFGADPDRKYGKETALSAALSQRQLQVVEFLEKQGAAVDPGLKLIYAAKHNDMARAKQAVAAGAVLNGVGGDPAMTALEAAAIGGHLEMVEFLLGKRANAFRQRELDTALYAAAGYAKQPAIVARLARAGASPNAECWGETALMAAARNGDLRMARLLLDLGADAAVENKERRMTAMDYAAGRKNKDMRALLSGYNVVARHEAGRILARHFSKAYSGRVTEHSSGFMLNAKFGGRPCQIHIDPELAGVNVFNLRFSAPEFRGVAMPSITIGRGKQDITGDFSRLRPAPAASKAAGIDVFSSLPAKDSLQPKLAAFCGRLQRSFAGLLTRPGEFLHFSSSTAALAWSTGTFEEAQPRLELFAKLLETIARAPQPERRLFDREWLIQPIPKASGSARPEVRHIFGGEGDVPRACPTCEAAANPIIKIELADPKLPRTPLGKSNLAVHWCLDCGEWSPTFFPLASGASIQTATEPETDNLSEREMTLSAVPAEKKAGCRSKVGGAPTWIQGDDTPDCEKCEKPMAFALQMNSDARISYADMGMLYAFVCPECRVVATVVQSH